ncbi:hypothetical protein HY632_03180 [Candidatus Uhrbacteria bacterium]|nr:hypothetical protein [Candidatus Uhrbacteria bacterium]
MSRSREQGSGSDRDTINDLHDIRREGVEREEGPARTGESMTADGVADRARTLLATWESAPAATEGRVVPEDVQALTGERQRIVQELREQLAHAEAQQHAARQQVCDQLDFPKQVGERMQRGERKEGFSDSMLHSLLDEQIRLDRVADAQQRNQELAMQVIALRCPNGQSINEVFSTARQVSGGNTAELRRQLAMHLQSEVTRAQVRSFMDQLVTFDPRSPNQRRIDPQAASERGVYLPAKRTFEVPGRDGKSVVREEPNKVLHEALVHLSAVLHDADPGRGAVLASEVRRPNGALESLLDPANIQEQLDAQRGDVVSGLQRLRQEEWDGAYEDARDAKNGAAKAETWSKISPELRTGERVRQLERSWHGPSLTLGDQEGVRQYFEARHAAKKDPAATRERWGKLSPNVQRAITEMLQ